MTHTLFSDTNTSGGAGTLLANAGVGAFVTYTVPVSQAGTYTVKVRVKTNYNRGIFRLAVGGVNQGAPQDEYSSAVKYGFRTSELLSSPMQATTRSSSPTRVKTPAAMVIR